MHQIVLVGGGHASATAARTLRRLGHAGPIVVVGDEPHAPYQRPALSKEFLDEGDFDIAEIASLTPEWCDANDVELRLGVAARHIDVATRAVTLADGSVLPADAVLIATGVRPRPFPGVQSKRVLSLRTLDDAAVLRKALAPDLRIAMVGGGFIGLEAAASARSRGAHVTVFEAGPAPLAGLFGDEVGNAVAALHRENGVDLRCNAQVTGITDTPTGVEVICEDGSLVEVDYVVVGIGSIPNDEIARASEITVGNGIRVDQFCRTSAPGIYAAGDVANHWHPGLGTRTRVEHFDNAARQAMVAVRNMMGERVEYADVHWFWSDQYEVNLQFAGRSTDWDRMVVRGDIDARDFVVFYLKDDAVVGAFGMDRGGDVMAAKALIAARRSPGDAILADPDADLMPDVPETQEGPETESWAGPDDEGFERVARSGQVTEGIVRRFMVGDLELAIARSDGGVYALHNICTHLACKLAAGQVEGGGLTCLCHGSIFELATGIPLNPPATVPVRTFPVIERDGLIYVKVR